MGPRHSRDSPDSSHPVPVPAPAPSRARLDLGPLARPERLFPDRPELGERLLRHLSGKRTTLRAAVDHFLSLADDDAIAEALVAAHGEGDDVSAEGVEALLRTCYEVALERSPTAPFPRRDPSETVAAVVESCMPPGARSGSAALVAGRLRERCPGLVPPLHSYCASALARGPAPGAPPPRPVSPPEPERGRLMGADVAWLLTGCLPPSYSTRSPLRPLPSHWTPLYDSTEDGLGANRFLHHVLAYRGPTVALLLTAPGEGDDADALFCVASPSEWRESTSYAGGPDSAALRLRPKLRALGSGARTLYLNAHGRGHPKGLRAGPDPRKPELTVGEGFDTLERGGTTHRVAAFEVWGCGDPSSRETQLDIKRWQAREVERQRQVKLSAADWIDHPDRYLLELAGRPQYNSSAE